MYIAAVENAETVVHTSGEEVRAFPLESPHPAPNVRVTQRATHAATVPDQDVRVVTATNNNALVSTEAAPASPNQCMSIICRSSLRTKTNHFLCTAAQRNINFEQTNLPVAS